MHKSSSRASRRRLAYFPIIHTAADLGSLAPAIQGRKLAALGREGVARNAALVEKKWEEMERAVDALLLPPGTVRVYQDGLPVCGHEQSIVSELAGAGSRNHRLLLKLQSRGATLMGTESPDLLVEEYQLATAAYGSGATVGTQLQQKELRDTLLDRRDHYISNRINETLAAGESGILFLGLLHDVTKYLDPEIQVSYPLGTNRVRQTLDKRH